MPCVLWGVNCLSLTGPTTAAEAINEFREALSVKIADGTAGSFDKLSADKGKPRVDLYRLVRIDDQSSYCLSGEEQVVAHLPDSSWGCRDIEDMCTQRAAAEVRYDRARESLVSLMESLDFGEVSNSTPRGQESRPVVSMRGVPMTPQAQQLCNVLRQENKMLRYKMNQYESMNNELKETCEMLRREFMLLVDTLMPRGVQPRQQASAASRKATPSVGSGAAASGAGPLISRPEASRGAGPLISGLQLPPKVTLEPRQPQHQSDSAEVDIQVAPTVPSLGVIDKQELGARVNADTQGHPLRPAVVPPLSSSAWPIASRFATPLQG